MAFLITLNLKAMSELTEERKAEKAKAAKDMRKYGLRMIFFGGIFYLICHYWLKIF